LENITSLTHREIPNDLAEFLKSSLNLKKKNKDISLAVVDNKLGKK
jgi:hypothetical protein